ncbi:MAG: cob(I)yrinic acid a,c-diamide adenosyltransferase [Chloroflexi bacterium]|nr:cob(I)yrinic acid a,c-diamide adenosyltransferase [Chloroflexota bacterium]MCI0783487.1 cob(I)yrinic acid a,c-diamide adenosyltransferase [Chloroflexota bacterium]MCI0814871.1 cob(I)yrinic acid a,c-diamide adenosyltransferase [Chloroflexota bacterium]MCI0819541.1 cob(I)yrinic acid a,c-diamide adenosyltransferase [Chloroflexota bacterium]MCI0831908.1 cob(I)yrinic acid a,c-diamide adenosyltransferase [Chloroflexota bacterium]
MPAKKPRKSMLYTRTGDDGTTALFGGRRVSKDDPRVEAYGAVDELNSVIGVAVSAMRRRRLISALQGIQNELFNVGSELASAGAKRADVAALFTDAEQKIAALEALTDEYDGKLPALRTFILPGGSQAGALLHLCRTVCRRAERSVVTLGRKEEVRPAIGAYLNRLSDLLFALARYENRAAKKPETEWRKG